MQVPGIRARTRGRATMWVLIPVLYAVHGIHSAHAPDTDTQIRVHEDAYAYLSIYLKRFIFRNGLSDQGG